MSGGVDSSTTAFLLLEQDYNVIGVHMRLGQTNEKAERAARQVCKKLGIKFYPINASHSFRQEVIDYFEREYAAGQTPNPCVKCNKVIKFGVLLDQMNVFEGDYLATGHYVRISDCLPQLRSGQGLSIVDGNYKLFRGVDEAKDQSYFLYTLTQEKLKHVLFPLGEYKKTEVRKIADKAGLPYLVSESQDVCFLNKDGRILEHNEYLMENIELKKGLIKTLDGEKVSEHKGLPLYTIGQRKGVEIGGTGPYYVVRADYKTNTLYVTTDRDDPALYSNEFVIKNTNWVSGIQPKLSFESKVVIRYRHKAVECEVRRLKSSNLKRGDWNSLSYLVKLKKPERAVTPGQSAVFYQGDEVLGGGIILYKSMLELH